MKGRRNRKGSSTITLLTLLVVLIPLAFVSDRAAGSSWPSWQQAGAVLPSWQEDGFDDKQLPESLETVARAGATWIEFTPTWYQKTGRSSEIQRTERTISDDGLERAIRLAHARGLRVLLKPHIDVLNKESRTRINPSKPSAWFESYGDFLERYAVMAQRLSVEQLSVGTDLSGVSGDRERWLALIKDVRGVYRGTLVYAAAHDEYQRVPFWDSVDLIGIDAYWPLASHPTTDPRQLTAAWRRIGGTLADFARAHHRQILFTEVGYTSQAGTVTDPDDWTISTNPAPQEQAAAYQALLASLGGQEWCAGVFWWVWIDLPAGGDTRLDYSFEGKPAEQVVRRFWGIP